MALWVAYKRNDPFPLARRLSVHEQLLQPPSDSLWGAQAALRDPNFCDISSSDTARARACLRDVALILEHGYSVTRLPGYFIPAAISLCSTPRDIDFVICLIMHVSSISDDQAIQILTPEMIDFVFNAIESAASERGPGPAIECLSLLTDSLKPECNSLLEQDRCVEVGFSAIDNFSHLPNVVTPSLSLLANCQIVYECDDALCSRVMDVFARFCRAECDLRLLIWAVYNLGKVVRGACDLLIQILDDGWIERLINLLVIAAVHEMFAEHLFAAIHNVAFISSEFSMQFIAAAFLSFAIGDD
jgi:hypothetical protein